MATLYRKYRPQLFSEINDQEHIVKTLQNEIAQNKIAHAYLFTGPRGVGKTTIARLLAKALNCKQRKAGEFEPCNTCSSCEEIAGGRNIDVIEIDAASHTGVDNVRENIIDNAQFKPTVSQYKIFIIDEVHMLSTSAFNALLKTIEEPPAHVVFILATTETHKLPATIISRCQRFGFKKLTRPAMLKKLEMICKEEKVKVEKSVLEKIITKSEGGMRDAESLLQQILSLNLREINEEDVSAILPSADLHSVLDLLECVANQDTKTALEKINELSERGTNWDQFFLDLVEILRFALIAQSGFEIKNIFNTESETIKKVKALSQKFSIEKLLTMIDNALLRRTEVKQAPIQQLPLEMFVMQFCAENNETKNVQPPNPPVATATDKIIPSVEKIQPASVPTKSGLRRGEAEPSITSSIKTAISNFTHRKPPQATLEQIQEKWPQVVAGISTTLPSLTFILKMCNLEKVDAEGLHLTCKFSIHKEKIEENKNKKTIEDELEKLIGERIRIVCDLNAEGQKTTAETEISNVAAAFGGEVQ